MDTWNEFEYESGIEYQENIARSEDDLRDDDAATDMWYQN